MFCSDDFDLIVFHIHLPFHSFTLKDHCWTLLPLMSAVTFLFFISLSSALNLFAPNKYSKGDKVELLLNKIESDHTQLPFHYHDLPFVCHDKTKKAKSMLLGEILRGDRFWESNYNLEFMMDRPCVRLCDMTTTRGGIGRADRLIRDGYVVHWNLDGLPGATTFTSENHISKYYAAGFPLGFVKDDISYLYNHVTLVIRYHTERDGQHTIVGFEVYPKSVSDHHCPGTTKDYQNYRLMSLKESQKDLPEKNLISYTYAVYWREDNSVTHANRWDLYYENDHSAASHKIHWFSLVNLLVLVCLVTLVVAIVMFRLLRTDLQSGPTIPMSQADFDINSSGLWKKLVYEVMKRPVGVLPLSILIAYGLQCLVAMVGVMVIFVLNSKLTFGQGSSANAFFNNHQGAFFTCSVVFLLASGFVSAYAGVIIHKILSNEDPNTLYQRRRVLILSCLYSGMLPFTILMVVLFINLFVWAKESSNALPFGTIVVLILLFAIIELPLGLLGGTLGNRVQFSPKSFIMKTHIPDKTSVAKSSGNRSIVMNPVVSVLAFGLIPFGIVYVDLLFIFNSVWLEKTTFFYMYGFLLLTVTLLVTVVGESAIVGTYLSLAMFNNPNWQWLCFRIGSSIGWYVYGYSIFYFVFHLHMSDFVSVLIYFAYMALVSCSLGITCGAVGVLTAMMFVRLIYGEVKAD